ncbi:MAG: transcription antitermination protein NusB [Holosporales bacterium]|jgi:transcription antitermination factor NusB|nr:transcription antitermination protein NusB [Holosporales bacterium]
MSAISVLSRARLAAVQFCYQSLFTDDSPPNTGSFIKHFIEINNDDEIEKKLDLSFFERLVEHCEQKTEIEEIIQKNLIAGKNLDNAPMMMHCVLIVAVSEMLCENTDIPIIINEYIEIAKGFLDGSYVRFINAILDKISKQIERKCKKKA